MYIYFSQIILREKIKCFVMLLKLRYSIRTSIGKCGIIAMINVIAKDAD